MANRLRLGIVDMGAQGFAYAQMISDGTVPITRCGGSASGDRARRGRAGYGRSGSNRRPRGCRHRCSRNSS
jgi:hypothetical protein